MLAAGAAGVVVLLLVVFSLGFWYGRRTGWLQPPVQAVPTTQAVPPRTWLSGAWTGGRWGADRIEAFGTWRGSPADTVVTYPGYATWAEITNDSNWHVEVFNGFRGTLVYGLPLLPSKEAGSLSEVAAGKHDAAFISVANVLRKNHRETTYLRIGLEANGDWFTWGAGHGKNTPAQFVAAYRHVAALMRKQLPKAHLVFDISCGSQLRGQKNRLDALTKLYPGDDLVDVVGCDVYDHYTSIAHTERQFKKALRPDDAVGLADLAEFATAHNKPFAVPEWGLTARDLRGGGDNPYFIYAMYSWFAAHAKDGRGLAFENYFNEPAATLRSSLWDVMDNPKASAEYRRLYSATPKRQ